MPLPSPSGIARTGSRPQRPSKGTIPYFANSTAFLASDFYTYQIGRVGEFTQRIYDSTLLLGSTTPITGTEKMAASYQGEWYDAETRNHYPIASKIQSVADSTFATIKLGYIDIEIWNYSQYQANVLSQRLGQIREAETDTDNETGGWNWYRDVMTDLKALDSELVLGHYTGAGEHSLSSSLSNQWDENWNDQRDAYENRYSRNPSVACDWMRINGYFNSEETNAELTAWTDRIKMSVAMTRMFDLPCYVFMWWRDVDVFASDTSDTSLVSEEFWQNALSAAFDWADGVIIWADPTQETVTTGVQNRMDDVTTQADLI